MNEITKLYKNAGIPKYGKRQCRDSEYLECQNYCFCNMDNKCDKFIFEYPPFTAEKQLNIIKFLGKIRDFHTCGRYCTALNSEGDSVESLQDKFEESLVGLINKLWTDLSEEEKQQVKGILE